MNKHLKYLYLFNLMIVFSTSLIMPYFAIMVRSFSLNLQTVGILQSIQIFSLICTTAVLAQWSKNKPNKIHLISGGWMLSGYSWLLLSGSTTTLTAGLAMLVNGFGTGLTSSTWSTMVAENLDKSKDLKEYSLWITASQSMIALAGLISPLIINLIGFPGLLFLIGILQFINGAVMLSSYPKN